MRPAAAQSRSARGRESAPWPGTAMHGKIKPMAVSALRVPFAPGESPFRGKGVTYRNFVDYVEEHLPGGRERLLAAIADPALRAFAAQRFLAGTFYDQMPMIPIFETTAALL